MPLPTGPSFVLSQIRRMVGLALAVCRGAAGRLALRAALGHRRLTGPTAPGLGLVLRQVSSRYRTHWPQTQRPEYSVDSDRRVLAGVLSGRPYCDMPRSKSKLSDKCQPSAVPAFYWWRG